LGYSVFFSFFLSFVEGRIKFNSASKSSYGEDYVYGGEHN